MIQEEIDHVTVQRRGGWTVQRTTWKRNVLTLKVSSTERNGDYQSSDKWTPNHCWKDARKKKAISHTRNWKWVTFHAAVQSDIPVLFSAKAMTFIAEDEEEELNMIHAILYYGSLT